VQGENEKLSGKIFSRLNTKICGNLTFQTNNHFILFMFLSSLSGLLDVPGDPSNSSFDPLESVRHEAIKFVYSHELVNRLMELSYDLLCGKLSEESITIPILQFLIDGKNEQTAFKIFLSLLPGKEFVLSDHVRVRELFANVLDRFSHTIRSSCRCV